MSSYTGEAAASQPGTKTSAACMYELRDARRSCVAFGDYCTIHPRSCRVNERPAAPSLAPTLAVSTTSSRHAHSKQWRTRLHACTSRMPKQPCARERGKCKWGNAVQGSPRYACSVACHSVCCVLAKQTRKEWGLCECRNRWPNKTSQQGRGDVCCRSTHAALLLLCVPHLTCRSLRHHAQQAGEPAASHGMPFGAMLTRSASTALRHCAKTCGSSGT